MIHDLALRWVVTLLFSLVVAECIHAIVTGRRSVAGVVGHSLHAIMAMAMAVMAWPWGASLPTTAPMLFFLAAAVWFTAVAFATAGHRGANAYHALMMLAMAWMYAVMGGLSLRPAAPAMPGMDMAGHGGHAGHAGHGGHGGHDAGGQQYAWVGIVNWICAVGFSAATLYWVYRYVAARRSGESGQHGGNRHWGLLCQAAMALGMAIMFGVML
jgi:hypothetical protein